MSCKAWLGGLARWEAFDARAAAILARAASAPSATVALSAALGVDPLMSRDDFFRHVFGDAEDVRGGQAVMCLRVQLLPVLLQRAVVAVMVIHAQRLSKSALRYCSDRARAHVRDQVPAASSKRGARACLLRAGENAAAPAVQPRRLPVFP